MYMHFATNFWEVTEVIQSICDSLWSKVKEQLWDKAPDVTTGGHNPVLQDQENDLSIIKPKPYLSCKAQRELSFWISPGPGQQRASPLLLTCRGPLEIGPLLFEEGEEEAGKEERKVRSVRTLQCGDFDRRTRGLADMMERRKGEILSAQEIRWGKWDVRLGAYSGCFIRGTEQEPSCRRSLLNCRWRQPDRMISLKLEVEMLNAVRCFVVFWRRMDEEIQGIEDSCNQDRL